MTQERPTLVIACGAIAHELVALKRMNGWHHLEITCLPAEWHNTPERITPGVERLILEHRQKHNDAHARILVAYADCGTGGHLDRLLNEHGIERLPGDHCYAFFAGQSVFDGLADDELGTFYLTDYLARNFQRLIIEGLGIARYPELRDTYFAHYRRVLYLAQSENTERLSDAQRAADSLGLPLAVHYTGLAPLESSMSEWQTITLQPAAARTLP